MRAPLSHVVAKMKVPVRIHVAIEDTELLDLLDRILDKGLFLGSANLLMVGRVNLSEADVRISVTHLHTNTDSYGPAQRSFLPAARMVKLR
jgi:hypothetical protein